MVDVVRSKLDPGVAEPSRQPRRGRKELLFSDVSSYVAAHCNEPLTAELAAARCGYSTNHFERLFRSYTGLTFHDFLLRQRINLCKRLLAASGDPVTDIAMRCGFGSIATFNRVFHTLEGITPSEFRSLMQTPRNAADGSDANTERIE